MSFFNLPLLAFLKNGQQTPVSKDTVTPANSTPLPVEITGASGDVAINAANLNIEVQTSGFGPYPDSMQLTDGTDTLAVNGDGSLSAKTSGQSVGGWVTELSINPSTWTALPAHAGRNGLGIQNRSGQEIKINYDNSVVGYVGIVVPNNGERYYDLSAAVPVYVKSASSSCTINVEELA